MMPVTLWSRKNKTGCFEHNHIESGHCSTMAPSLKSRAQEKAWTGCEWLREHAWIDAEYRVLRNGSLALSVEFSARAIEILKASKALTEQVDD